MHRTWIVAGIALALVGCASGAPAAAPGQAAPAPAQPASGPAAGSGPIAIIRDGNRLPGTAVERNGTLYLPVAVLFPDGKQPPQQNGQVPIVPGYSIDVARNRLVMRAGEDEIYPSLVIEDGQVLAPLSFFRFSQGLRVQYNPENRRVVLTAGREYGTAFPEEIPEEVKRFAEQAGGPSPQSSGPPAAASGGSWPTRPAGCA